LINVAGNSLNLAASGDAKRENQGGLIQIGSQKREVKSNPVDFNELTGFSRNPAGLLQSPRFGSHLHLL
jgi:hypothetical protein